MIGKRLVALGLAAVTALSLTACGGSASGEDKSGNSGDSAGAASSADEASSAGAASSADAGEGTGASQAENPGALAQEAAPNTVKSDETLVVSMASEPAMLWCTGSGQQDNQALVIQNCLTDRLVTYDKANNEVLPCLATEWEWLDENRIQFKLREDVMMQDGTPLVADDVLYTIKVATEYSPNNDSGRWFDYEACEAVDDQTVIVALKTVAPDFLSMLSEVQFGIVCEADVEAAGGVEAATKNPLFGAGKYKFKEWKNGQYVLLERNEDYWNKDYTGYYKEIKFTFTNDAATREMAVESGDANVAMEIPANIAASFMENGAIQTQLYTTDNVMHLFFNCRDGACTDKAVREAVSYALDVNALNQVGTAGYGQVSNGWFIPGGTYYVDAYEGAERTQDIEKAKQILSDAGYGGGLALKTVSTQVNAAVLTVIQEQLRLAGITLEVASLDTAQYVQEAKAGNYDIIMVGSAIETRKPNLFTFYQKKDFESVIGGSKFTTDELDAKITEMVETSDVDRAKELSGEIIKTIKDECYAVDLYTEYKAVVMSKDIAGFTTLERGYLDCTSLYVPQ